MKIFLFVLLGILSAFLIIVLLIYLLIRFALNKFGLKGKGLLDLYKKSKQINEADKQRVKNISGMTKVILPVILEDFPEFNENQFYLLVEKSLRNIFLALENKTDKYLREEEFNIIRQKILLQIDDLKDNNISYKFDDIIFHKHAIKSYKKEKGMVILTISSSLEYYYVEKRGSKIVSDDQFKKQTRYTTKFVYIVDNQLAGFDLNVLSLNCPNCGSPVTKLTDYNCTYCNAVLNIQVANLLKCWKIIDYKEDY